MVAALLLQEAGDSDWSRFLISTRTGRAVLRVRGEPPRPVRASDCPSASDVSITTMSRQLASNDRRSVTSLGQTNTSGLRSWKPTKEGGSHDGWREIQLSRWVVWPLLKGIICCTYEEGTNRSERDIHFLHIHTK